MTNAGVYRTATPTYRTVHTRITAAKGHAREHVCAWPGCSAPGNQWAYDHSDPTPLVDYASGCEYTTNITRYRPLCFRHHRADDASPVCLAGHPYPVSVKRDSHGWRVCVTCWDARNARRRTTDKTPDVCNAGHAKTEQSWYVAPNGRAWCRVCRNARLRERYATDSAHRERMKTAAKVGRVHVGIAVGRTGR